MSENGNRSIPKEVYCDRMIRRLARLFNSTCKLARTEVTKDSVAQCVSLAQQIGVWIDRRARFQRESADDAAPAAPASVSSPSDPGAGNLEQLESDFVLALEDIRHAKHLG